MSAWIRPDGWGEGNYGNILDKSSATNADGGWGLQVNAGHGLNYINIKRFEALPLVEEYSIGHSIVAMAVLVGFEQAVRKMTDLVKSF